MTKLAKNGMPIWIAVCLLFLVVTAGWAQRAADVAGMVTDPTGAVVVDAEVTVTNVDTGSAVSTRTNQSGLYRILGLLPGPYEVSCSLTGFKQSTTEIVLEVGRATTVDIGLEIGAIVETVTIEAEAAVLQTESSQSSDYIEQQFLRDMPLITRRPTMLFELAKAVTFTGAGTATGGVGGYGNAFYSVAGGREATQQFYFDGGNASNTRVEIAISDINPPMETMQEFRLIEANAKAEFGGSGGGLMLMTTKSGTNAFHGDVWEFHRQKVFNARNFFAAERSPFRNHLFGAALGGPIVKNKVHFFISYEGERRFSPSEAFRTFPTPAQVAGDFSERRNSDGSLHPIFDPLSNQTQPDGSIVRTQFQNNIIPSDRMHPVGAAIASFYPAPNRAGEPFTGANNYFGVGQGNAPRNGWTARADWSKSEANRFFGRFMRDVPNSDTDGPLPGFPGFTPTTPFSFVGNGRHPADPSDGGGVETTQNFTFGWTNTKAAFVNELRVTYSDRTSGGHHSSTGQGFPEQLGLPTPVVSPRTSRFDLANDHFPKTRMGRYFGLGASWPGAGGYQTPMRNYHISETVSLLRGDHFFKAGVDVRKSEAYYFFANQSSGEYRYNTSATAAFPGDPATGDELASLLLDQTESAQLNDLGERHFTTWLPALFVQDDWKIHPNVTLSIGLRWETDTPMTEEEDRISGFDFNANNPVCDCPGTVTFPTKFNESTNNWQPRIGLVWKFAPQTVLRLGAGRFYNPPYGASIWFIPGFARPDIARSATLSSPDNGITPAISLSNGIPSPPTFQPSDLGPGFGAAAPGQQPFLSPDFFEFDRGSQTNALLYNANIQRNFGANVLGEIGWIANIGHNLNKGELRHNQVPTALMGLGNNVPFRPFPQFDQVPMVAAGMGNSTFHALTFKAEKRYSKGLAFLWHYTWSQFLDDFCGGYAGGRSCPDFYNRGLDKGPSSFRRAHRMVFSTDWQVPLGKGHTFLAQGPAAHILGGWNIASVIMAQSGEPLTLTAAGVSCNCNNGGAGQIRPNLVGDPNGARTIDSWYNESAFEHQGSLEDAIARGDLRSVFGNSQPGVVDGPGMWLVNLSISKEIPLTERVNLRLRGEFFNSLNHTNFGNPSTNIFPTGAPGSTNIIRSALDPRIVQLALKLNF
jgi:hypothetical protein